MPLPVAALARAALGARCPRCERGALFQGILTLRPRCPVCDYDLGRADTGDGPAVFMIFIIGFLFLPIVVWSEVTADRPAWASLLIWGPPILILTVGLLRPSKALSVALAYHTRRDQAADAGDDPP